jgi:hypothetical protein
VTRPPFPLFCNVTKRILSQVVPSFYNILRMKTDVSGLNAAKFQVKAHYASLP